MFNAHGLPVLSAGYVRTVFSGRMRGHAVPLDLVRVHLRAVNSAGMARRLRAAFAGYLVSDDEAGLRFGGNRKLHEYGFLPECVSGSGSVGFRVGGYNDEAGGPIDAPGFMPAGSMRRGGFGGFCAVVRREGWLRFGAGVFSSRRWWHECTGRWCATGMWLRGDDFSWGGFVLEEVGYCLDAPQVIPAGGCKGLMAGSDGSFIPAGIVCWRGGE